jgi:hypothetical protein
MKLCRCVRMRNLAPSVNRLSRQCGILNILQPYRPPRSVTGIALLFFFALLEIHTEYRGYLKMNTSTVSSILKQYLLHTKHSFFSRLIFVTSAVETASLYVNYSVEVATS